MNGFSDITTYGDKKTILIYGLSGKEAKERF